MTRQSTPWNVEVNGVPLYAQDMRHSRRKGGEATPRIFVPAPVPIQQNKGATGDTEPASSPDLDRRTAIDDQVVEETAVANEPEEEETLGDIFPFAENSFAVRMKQVLMKLKPESQNEH